MIVCFHLNINHEKNFFLNTQKNQSVQIKNRQAEKAIYKLRKQQVKMQTENCFEFTTTFKTSPSSF
jgi:hypothetical protein